VGSTKVSLSFTCSCPSGIAAALGSDHKVVFLRTMACCESACWESTVMLLRKTIEKSKRLREVMAPMLRVQPGDGAIQYLAPDSKYV
jgi:hypothetical protein